ncbi:MAG TPA: TonB-dependent receptor, partial [Blastocatellia bacterium]|nr:TonB-dependent receptor [Blastocatellia bacterium]
EHNDYNGFETQPNVRLLWTPSAHQVVWAAVSRAVRTPTRNYEDIRVTLQPTPGPGGLPIVPTLLGNKKSKTEEGRAYEFGYRIQPGKKLSLDLATFYNRYDLGLTVEEGLPFFEPNPQPAHLIIPLRFDNLLRSETYGWEASANLDLVRRWKVRGSFSGLRVHLHAPSQSTVPEAAPGLQPRQQFQLHSYLKLPRNFELGHSLYYVSGLSETQIPAYTRFDTRLGWRVREGIELSLELQNLLDDRHPEFNSLDTFVVPSQVGRSIYGKMAWRF